jgi:hypothetical protein
MTNSTPAANSSHAAAPVVRIPDERLARIFRDDETRRAIEARLNGEAHIQAIRDRLNREARHITIRPVHPVADWLERTFADRLGWFIATLFPICVAAFCVGWFGIRELLAGFGL